MLEITKDQIQLAIEKSLDLETPVGSALQLFRALREAGQLSNAEKDSLVRIERAIASLTGLYFETLAATLGSKDGRIDSPTVRSGLGRLENKTVNQLVDYLYPPDKAARLKLGIERGGADKDSAIDDVVNEFTNCNCSAEQLREVLGILANDPRNLPFKFLLTKIDALLEKLKEWSGRELRSRLQARATPYEAITDTLVHNKSPRVGELLGHVAHNVGELLFLSERKESEYGGPQAEELHAIEKRIHDLEKNLKNIMDALYKEHQLATAGPKEDQFEHVAERNRLQFDLLNVQGLLNDYKAQRYAA